MNINQPRILAVAALLALAALATPVNAQNGDLLTPECEGANLLTPECFGTGVVDPTDTPAGPEPCPEGTTGVTDPVCVPDDADPTAGIPCVDETAECPVPEAPCPVDPDVVACLTDLVTGLGAEVDAAVCEALTSEEATADACIQDAVANSPANEVVNTVLALLAPTADAGANATVPEGTLNVALDGSASASTLPLPVGNDLTYDWVQTGGITVSLNGANTSAPTFNAPGLDGLQETVTFELTVTDLFGSATDEVEVIITNVATDDSSIGVIVDTAAAVMTLQGPASAPDVAPDGTTATAATYFVAIDTQDGVEHINNSLLAFSVTDPNTVATSESFDSTADSEDFPGMQINGPNVRTYTYGLSLPGRLTDGIYTVAASYNGSAPTELTFNVDNVAPTISGTSALHNGRASFPAVSTAVEVILDDFNWGTYDGSPVSELASLDFAIVPDLAQPVTGFTFSHDLDGDATFTDGALSLVGETGNGAITVPLTVAYDGTVEAGTYTVTATVTDNNGASASFAFLTITLVPANFGFSLLVNDGGDGVSIGTATPDGAHYTTEADPLEVQITGTLNAAVLNLAIGNFTNVDNGDIIAVEGMTVQVYGEGAVIGTDAPDFEGAIADGVLAIDLASLNIGLSEESVFLVFDVQVYPGTDAANYSTAVDLLSTADE